MQRSLSFLLLSILLLLCRLPSTASLACNSTSPSLLNAVGCQLSSFSASNYTFSVTLDPVALPNVLLTISASQSTSYTLSAYFLNGALYKTLGQFNHPLAVTVDAQGYVFLTDSLQGIAAFSPYPSYTFLGWAITQSYLTSGASVTTLQGEYLYYTSNTAVYVYLLSFNATGVSGRQVASIPLSLNPFTYSLKLHPLTGQLYVFDATNVVLHSYTPSYLVPTAPTFALLSTLTPSNSSLSALLTSATTSFRSALSAITATGDLLFLVEGSALDNGAPLLTLWMTVAGTSPYLVTNATLLLTPSIYPSSFYLTVNPPFPTVAVSLDGSFIAVPIASAMGGVYTLQGVTGSDPAGASIPFPVFLDLNSSFTVLAALPSPLLYSGTSVSYVDSGYSTAAPGSVVFAIEVLSTGPNDVAYVSFTDTAVLPAGVTIVPLNATSGCSATAVTVFATLGTIKTLVCLYAIRWTTPVTGNVIIHSYSGKAVGTAVYSEQQTFISIPLSGAYIFFNADEQFSVPLLLGSSPSTQHVYSDLAPLTYQPIFTGQAQTYMFSLRSYLGDTSDVAYLGIPAGVTFTSLTNNTRCDPLLSSVPGTVNLTSPSIVLQCDYQLSWTTPFSSTMGILYTASQGASLHDTVSIYIEFLQSAAAILSRTYDPVLTVNGVSVYPTAVGVTEAVLSLVTDVAGSANLTLSWNGDGANTGFTLPSAFAHNSLVALIPAPGSPAQCRVAGGQQLLFGYFQNVSSCSYTLTWLAGFQATATLGINNALQLTGAGADGGFVFAFNSPNGTLCVLLYSLPGDVDYPWSVATSLTFTYVPTVVSTAFGQAVNLLSGTGRRTFTNRFGASTTAVVTLVTSATPSLLYINSPQQLDSTGLLLSLGQAVQLPGVGPSSLFSTVALFSSSGSVRESNSSLIDPLGSAFLSSLPSVVSTTIPASNVNSLAALYSTCQAPITFTNGLRTPTQPSTFNGAVVFGYSYFLSDGLTYSVTANLTFTATSAFATTVDELGNPYQNITAVVGTRTYTSLLTGLALPSTVLGLSSGSTARFYPYSLLGSAPGVYTENTAPFFDAQGVTFSLSTAVPLLGLDLGLGLLQSTITLRTALFSSNSTALLTETGYISLPLHSLQQQLYTLP